MKQVCRKLVLSILPLFLLCLLAPASHATTVVMLSDKEMIVSSRVILTGEVRSVTTAWDDAQKMVWTYVEVRRDRVLKGSLGGRRLVLKQIGGQYGQTAIRFFGQPEFLPGQRVLLYLNTAPDGSLHVAHAFMGMFSIVEDDQTGNQFVQRSGASAEVEILPRRLEEPVTDRAPLEDYLRNIEDTLQRESAEVARVESEASGHPINAVPAEYHSRRKEAPGYTPSFAFMGGGVRWMQADSGQPINYYVNPANSPIAGGASAELARAMDAWTSQSGANIRLQAGGQSGQCGAEGDNQNVISFGDCRGQLDPPQGGCSGVVAQTNVRYMLESRVINGRSFYRLIESDIVFNRGMDCFLGNSSNLAEVACHELGHSIGLDHSSDPSAIMFAVAHGRGFDATLGADDRAGVQAIYPGSSVPPPPPPPTPSQNDAAFVAQSVPLSMTAGQTYSVSVTMRNSGNATWASADYKLGSQSPHDNVTWGLNRVNLPYSAAPGSQVSFSFNVVAPSSPGSYSFQWRMLQDGPGYFGESGVNALITVNAADSGGGGKGGPVAIISFNLAEGVIGRTYKHQLSASGGTPPYRWSLVSGSLPSGLTLSQSGMIEGVPRQAGVFPLGVQVFDLTGSLTNTDSKRLTLTINEAGGPPSAAPTVNRVKVKGSKKLFVYGSNFNVNSLIQLNGRILYPELRSQSDGSQVLFFKGRLGMVEAGANVLFVMNAGGNSPAFVF